MLYANTINHGYVLDDPLVINENKITQKGIAGIPTILTSAYRYGYNDDKPNIGFYRPLSVISFAFECELFGLNPRISHLINVLLYALTGIIVFILLSQLLGSQWYIVSVLTTLFFLAHPIHTEVVANLKSRDEILAFLFAILSWIMIVKYYRSNSTLDLTKGLLSLFFAFLSKENVLLFVLIIPISLYFFEIENRKRFISTFLLLLIPVVSFLIIRYMVIDGWGAGSNISLVHNSLLAAQTNAQYVATAIYLFGKYISILIFPYALIYDYSFNQIRVVGFNNVFVLTTIVCTVGLIIFVIMKSKKRSMLSFWVIYYLICISIVSNLFIKLAWTFGERFLYVPSLAFCFLLAFLVVRLFERFNDKKTLGIVSCAFVILIVYSFKTVDRNNAWKDNLTLFKTDVKTGNNSSRIHAQYAMELIAQSKFQDDFEKSKFIKEAIFHYKKAIEILPEFAALYIDLGVAYSMLGNNNKAYESYQKALSIDPQNGEALYHRGLLLLKDNKLIEAETAFNEGLKYLVDHNIKISCFMNLSNLESDRGNLVQAIQYCKEALNIEEHGSIRKHLANLYYVYGNSLITRSYKIQNSDEKSTVLNHAFEQINLSIVLDPINYRLYNSLGNIYFLAGDLKNAINNYNVSLNINPDIAETYHNLGNLYSSQNELIEANKYYKRALKVDKQFTLSYINLIENYRDLGLDDSVELYKNNSTVNN